MVDFNVIRQTPIMEQLASKINLAMKDLKLEHKPEHVEAVMILAITLLFPMLERHSKQNCDDIIEVVAGRIGISLTNLVHICATLSKPWTKGN